MIEILSMSAAAPAAGASGGGGLLGLVLPFVAMAAVMYFLIIRPQQQQRKRHQSMLDDLKRGDTIITNGGLIGKVTKIAEDEISVDLGETRVRVARSMILTVKGKGEPVAATDKT